MAFKMSWRVWLLIIVVLFMIWSINPRLTQDGLQITSVVPSGPAANAGIQGPVASVQPVMRERVLAINGISITDDNSFEQALATVDSDSFVQVRTNANSYAVQTFPTQEQAYENYLAELNDSNSTNTSTNVTLPGPFFNPNNPLGFSVREAATSNIRLGLDLTGGARVLLAPDEPVDDDIMELVLSQIQERLNVFGLSDVTVRSVKDFSGNQFVLVEIAGANQDDILRLLSSQGQFEAKIGDKVVFRGGDDIRNVARSATESGINQCAPSEGGFFCSFFFGITLSPEAAQRQADATRNLSIIPGSSGGGSGQGEGYLSEQIDMFLDGENVTSLNIGAGLRGRAETQIQISGSEVGLTQEAAARAAQAEMKRLQTLLETGSLPVKLQVVKTDGISPALGAGFIKNIWLVGLAALLAVILVVSTRYRDWKIAIPMVVTMISEIIIILGMASMIGWNLDLAAIAGIIIAIGTGVDDQIVMVDEVKSGGRRSGSWSNRMKKAFFIIFAAFFTLVAAMLPLMWAGAGLVRGFAFTTVLGVTIGVLITRPAFAAIAEQIVKVKD